MVVYVGVWCQTEVHAPALQYDPGEIVGGPLKGAETGLAE